MKHLPKHLRPRWRYLAVELESPPDATYDRDALQRAIWYAAGNLLGDPGSADTDLSVVRFRRGVSGEGERDGDGRTESAPSGGRGGSAEATAAVRVRRDEVQRGRAVIACLDAVAGSPVRTRVRGVSGTVRACEEKYLNAPRAGPRDRTVAFAGADRRALARGRRVDVELADGHAGATALDYRTPDR
ncbi:Rpp14/Pop5 family protein [Haloglomus litoreum]|uniref:Rpp14/Pop5 family protein n=1 Tax=Haloglomus litoreum TaxID=3034026 RepID=UPI0023E7863C|nr:Rpp14/Pop5 family protein [Haloglomus sp. DT116]